MNREHNIFDAATYRAESPDLRHLTDVEAFAHFEAYGKSERRTFGKLHDEHDRMSMRWLRGSGIEIGAGSAPTRLFGNATAILADTDPLLKYGGHRVDEIFSLDDASLLERVGRARFDFAIASHVLEHLDSAIRGLENLVGMVRPGGTIYVAVPIKEYLHDKHWMPHFPFEHHVAEYAEPLKFAEEHDALIGGEHQKSQGGTLTIAPSERFQHHKHNYDFQGWLQFLLQSVEYLGLDVRLVDACFGGHRQDANFVLLRGI